MKRLLLPIALLAPIAVPVPAEAAKKRGRTIDKSPLLWATVNICDTRRHADTIGIRASMPGSGRKRERMFMRFKVQYFSTIDNLWHNFLDAEGTDSGWRKVGSAKYRARQSGWSFPFELEEGQRYEVRGVVKFQWRKRGRVVRSASKRTRGGHRTKVADPKRYSAATCVLEG